MPASASVLFSGFDPLVSGPAHVSVAGISVRYGNVKRLEYSVTRLDVVCAKRIGCRGETSMSYGKAVGSPVILHFSE